MEAPLALQFSQCLAHSDDAAIEPLGQLSLAGQAVAG